MFDDLKVTPVEGYQSIITRVDDHDASVIYSGGWYRTVPDGYVHFNRTISRSEGEDAKVAFSFVGSHFAIVGQTSPATIEVYVDGKLFETAEVTATKARQCSYHADLESGKHDIVIKVISGSFTIDVIEY